MATAQLAAADGFWSDLTLSLTNDLDQEFLDAHPLVSAARSYAQGTDALDVARWYVGQTMTTRADTNKAVRELNAKFPKKTLTARQRTAYHEAHHSMMQQRHRLGLSKQPYTGSRYTQETDFASLQSDSGFVLSVLKGMSYGGGSNTVCYDAAESFVIAYDTGLDVWKKAYYPWFWAECQVSVQDFTAISSAVYVDCDVNKFFNSVQHLFSTEGLTEATGRIGGAFFFEIQEFLLLWNADDVKE